MELFSPQEIQEILKYLNRAPLGFAERLFAQGFFQRLVDFCQPPKPEPEEPIATESTSPPPGDGALQDTVTGPPTELVPDDAQALANALAIADALDEADKPEKENTDEE